MWPKLRRVFDYAEVELSNNLAENSMRPIALGRKNWLHISRITVIPGFVHIDNQCTESFMLGRL